MVDIMELDIATTVTDSLIDAFDVMLSMELRLSNDPSQTISEDERIVGSVGVGGMVMGYIHIETSREFSRVMTAAMLNMEVDEVESENDIKDVIRELSNIIVGDLKSALCDAGLNCEFSSPSFTTGGDFKIESLDTVRHERYVFSHEKHMVIVEVGVRVKEEERDADRVTEPLEKLKPVDVKQVRDFDVATPVRDRVIEVFNMMLSMELEISDQDLTPMLNEERLVAAVSFVGPLVGFLSIQLSREFSHKMTAAMSGIQLDEVEGEEDVKDIITKLCFFMGGNLKSMFCDSGMGCALSTPSLTTGSNFRTENNDMDRYERFSFCQDDNPIIVEVALKVNKDESEEVVLLDESPQESTDALWGDERVSKPEPAKTEEDRLKTEGLEEPPDDGDTLADEERIAFILDIPLDIVVELGRNKMPISDLYKLGPGSIVEFTSLAGETVDILVNGTLIAKGEVMVQGEKYGIRIVDILSRMERIRKVL